MLWNELDPLERVVSYGGNTAATVREVRRGQRMSRQRTTDPAVCEESSKSARLRTERALFAVTVFGYAVAFRSLPRFDGLSGARIHGNEVLFFEPTGSSPPLIFALTLFMLAVRGKRLRARFATARTPAYAFVLLGLGSLLAFWAHYVARVDLQVPALSLILLGVAGTFAGREGARLVAFPALFLLLAAPLPRVMVTWIVWPLQLATASATTAIVSLLGAPATQLGDLIVVRGRVFQVIESCAGLRSVTTMIMTAMIYSDLFSRGRRHTAVLVAVSPLLGLMVNELRVLSLVVNPYATDETIHAAQGIAMIVVGVLLLAGLDRVLVRHGLRNRRGSRIEAPRTDRPSGRIAPAIAAALAAGLAALTYALAPWELPPDTAPQVSSFPGVVGDWQVTARRPIDRRFLGSVAFDRCALRDYARGEETIELLLCADRRADGGDRMLSRKLWVPGPGSVNSDLGALTLPVWPHRADVSIARSFEEARLVVHWRVGARSLFTEIFRGFLGLDRGPCRRADRAVAIRVSTLLGEGGIERARMRISDFLTDAAPALMRQAAVRETLPAALPDPGSP